MDPKSVIDQAIALVQAVNSWGGAAETALIAFREKLFPTFSASGAEDAGESFGSLSERDQAAVLAHYEAAVSGS